jgi:uncharacterized protein YbbC (DUF1343 family)
MKAALLAICLSLSACAAAPRAVSGSTGSANVLTGLDALERDGFAQLRGKRVGLITNHTGRDRSGRATMDVLAAAPGVTLAALFSPEHGFAGAVEDKDVLSSTISAGGREIPVYSLYANGVIGMRPKPEQLYRLDALVFDIQDIGSRFYTYLTTMGMALEEAKKADIEFIVLDRPNPINGVTMEGPVLDDLSLRKITATAYFPVTVRHGMTAGEIATMHNAEVGARLTTVRLRGWSRSQWYDETGLPWIAPSPNMPELEAALMYPGIGIFEASNVSVGRGTPWPFRWVGAPWIDGEKLAAEMNAALLDGVRFSAQSATPTKSNFKGLECGGVRMTVTDRDRLRPLAVFRKLEEALRRDYPSDFAWRWDEAKRMVGTAEFQRLIEHGADAQLIQHLFNRQPEDFEKARKPFLLY